jgi:nitroreductase
MNPVLEAMEQRRSVRAYKPDAVPQEVIERICRAGSFSATGMNQQSPVILAVSDPALRNKLSAMNAAIMGVDFDPFYGAPVVLVVLADRSKNTYLYDGSLVMGNLMLAAYAEGLGSCWVHRAKEEFDSDEGKAMLSQLGIEGDYEGIGHCILGYPASDLPEAAPRKEGYTVFVK